MPTKPVTVTKNLTAADMKNMLGAIRKNASQFYRNQTFAVTNERDLQRLWAQLNAYESLTQEFMSILWGRIAKTIITSKMWRNPLGFLKKGEVELGEVIEEAFVNPAKVHIYDDNSVPDEATLRREPSEVYSAFYVMNYQTFYKVTIHNNDLQKFFLSWDGVESLIAKMTESLYTAAYLDEYNVMKYMVGQQLLSGMLYTRNVGDFENDPKTTVVGIKQVSNDLIFMRKKYNRAGVYTYTGKEDQFFLVTSNFDALESVEVQAAAFNLDKVQFTGQRILVDSFGELDLERLDELFKNNPDYVRPTKAELQALDNIAGVIIDRDWFQIYDNLNKFTEQYNGQKLFWNYFLHVWRTFASSPFANAVALVQGDPGITSVTVTPSAVSLAPGEGIALSVAVENENFASAQVTWSSSDPSVTVNQKGYVKVLPAATVGTATITATSTVDSTKFGTCTLTITS